MSIQEAPREAATLERYARLHRLIENGGATDEVRRQLISACVTLGKEVEAVRMFEELEDPGIRRGCRRTLSRLGWVSEHGATEESGDLMVTEAMLNLSVREKLADAATMLYEPRLRPIALGGTMVFPLCLGVTGFLTAGSTAFLPYLLALFPALLLVGVLAALCREIVLLSIEGQDEVDELPGLSTLFRRSGRCLLDLLVIAGVSASPAIAMMALGFPWTAVMLLGAAGMFLPLALALRFAGASWRSLRPEPLVAAIRRLSPPYPEVGLTCAAMLAPASTVLLFAADLAPYVTVSVVGPLAVVPALLAARILGLTLHYERDRLQGLPVFADVNGGGGRVEKACARATGAGVEPNLTAPA